MPKPSIEWIIEYRSPKQRKYDKGSHGFHNEELAFEVAKAHKEKSPEMGVRIVEQTRKVLKVF